MKKIAITLLLLLSAFALSAAFDSDVSDDLFYHQEAYKEDMDYLLSALNEAETNSDKAAILWRLSRTQLYLTDEIPENQKKERIAGYEESENWADQSLAIEESADAYHWKASAIGRVGQVNGPLNSLSKAKPMRELIEKVQNTFNADMSDAWYVLSLLYDQLPGAPISFGNDNFAISYIRRCVDTQDNVNRLNLTNYLELAQQLHARGWNASKRAKELDKMQKNWEKESVPTEKMKYYEGRDGRETTPFYSALPLGEFSDKQEAVMVCQYALAVYSMKENPLPSETAKAESIEAFLSSLTK
ncbi:MAG: hypothetical protein IAA97_04630 [Spirochaetes bacterium]|uniref:Uncharacterized protein n=1 Tax=Candidatus Ornithospirochaeta stercoripullorum TaxID=2840899 RepID=A0A9D9E356_9SPIO|nr:hypothetical protein [Candidatus Ornithospirochaeta stercoripullorum]